MKLQRSMMGLLAIAALMIVCGVTSASAQMRTNNEKGGMHWRDNAPGNAHGGPMMGNRGQMKQGISGTVESVSDTTLTVTGRQFGSSMGTAATTTYTVDALNAQIIKDRATSSISSITAGDMVMVQGTISGTNVTATLIRDGAMPGRDGGFANGTSNGPGRMGSSTPPMPFEGNGQPVIAGSVSSISGSVFTVTNKSNVVYTVDASNATFVRNQNAISLSDVAQGDEVVVQGTINGTDITAATVIDQTHEGGSQGQRLHLGFFGTIGIFFKHIFGF